MRVKVFRPKNLRRPAASEVINFATSAIMTCIGLFSSLPFIYIFVVLGFNFHYISFWIGLTILGLIVGGPLFVCGIIGLISSTRSSGYASSAELDLARIRFSVENESRKP